MMPANRATLPANRATLPANRATLEDHQLRLGRDGHIDTGRGPDRGGRRRPRRAPWTTPVLIAQGNTAYRAVRDWEGRLVQPDLGLGNASP